MSYRTIFVHWDGTEGEGGGVPAADLAAALPGVEAAHLVLTAIGIEPGMLAYSYGGPGAAVIAAQTEAAAEEAERRLGAARAWLERRGLPGETRALQGPVDLVDRSFADAAMLSDLVVLGAPYGSPREEVAVRVLEGALFRGAAPVLVAPEGPPPATLGKRILVAWDEGMEALQAVRGALPLLKGAEAVDLFMIDPEPATETGVEPGDAAALWLSRHGVPVTLELEPSAGHTVAEVLARRMRETGADLLVMGAYSHSRLREALIGGPTRDILEALPGPVLMAH